MNILVLVLILMVQNFVLSEEIQCYGVLFDAGSSSTKTSIYQYPCRK